MTPRTRITILAASIALTANLAAIGHAQTPPAAPAPMAKPAPVRKPNHPRPPAHDHAALKSAIPYLQEAKAKLQHNYKGDEAARQQVIGLINQALTLCGTTNHNGQ